MIKGGFASARPKRGHCARNGNSLRPKPAQLRRRAGGRAFVNSADDNAIGQYVIVLVLPLTGSVWEVIVNMLVGLSMIGAVAAILMFPITLSAESGELTPAVPLTPAGPSVLDGNGEVIEQLAGVEEFRTSR
jgi:hypothetical protein